MKNKCSPFVHKKNEHLQQKRESYIDKSENSKQSKMEWDNLKLANTYVTTYTFIYEYTL